MEEQIDFKPWEKLIEIADKGDAAALEEFASSLAPSEVARALSHLDEEEQRKVLTMLPVEDAADFFEEMSDAQAADLLEILPSSQAASILSEMQSDDQADVLSNLEEEDAAAILSEMEPEEAEDARQLAAYEPDTAGGLMVTEYLAFKQNATVKDVVDDLTKNREEYADYNLQYIYVISENGELVGVLRMRDLLLSPKETPIAEILIKNPLFVYTSTHLDELVDFFESHSFYGVPVVNEDLTLVGVVLQNDIASAIAERSDTDLLKTQGIVGGEELRTMPIFVRSRRRLSWLTVNIILNIISASIIAIYQDTLSSVIALAVFLPIISDMSGCSGNQAVAVSLRELALGIVKPFEVFRVLFQELYIGILNGIVLGVLLGGVAWIWKGNFYLSAVICTALAVNTIIAVLIGGAIPLILKRFGKDPALASSPILTTITDMCGFFLVLSMATIILSKLV